jgi:acetyltransferase
LSHVDANEMIREIRGFPMLKGVRGSQPCDIEALADLLVSVSDYVSNSEDLSELDLNPVRVYPDGVQALDVRIMRKKQPSL